LCIVNAEATPPVLADAMPLLAAPSILYDVCGALGHRGGGGGRVCAAGEHAWGHGGTHDADAAQTVDQGVRPLAYIMFFYTHPARGSKCESRSSLHW
jgi:hypothetical protein